jgi:hypothetical protein
VVWCQMRSSEIQAWQGYERKAGPFRRFTFD